MDLMSVVFLAETTVSLPDWVPPSVMVIIGLAIALYVANQRGLWISGREHSQVMARITEQYEARLKEKDDRLTYVEARREEERTARLDDARSFGQVAAQLRTAAEDLQEVEALFGGERSATNQYEQRLDPRRRPSAGTRSSSRRQHPPANE